MNKPIIGITGHSHPAALVRSAVVQLYVDPIQDAGGAAIVIPLGLDESSLCAIFPLLDGLLLPGGDDVAPDRYHHEPHPRLGAVDPDRDELELRLATWALDADLPVLGICRGIQVLAVAAGGSLCQDIPSEWEDPVHHDVREFGRDHLCHPVTIDPASRLGRVLGLTTSQVNSFHHQAVHQVPPGFAVSARSDDGVVEGIEALDRSFAVGVQCHPEGMWRTTAPEYRQLFVAFVGAAAQHARTRRVMTA